MNLLSRARLRREAIGRDDILPPVEFELRSVSRGRVSRRIEDGTPVAAEVARALAAVGTRIRTEPPMLRRALVIGEPEQFVGDDLSLAAPPNWID